MGVVAGVVVVAVLVLVLSPCCVWQAPTVSSSKVPPIPTNRLFIARLLIPSTRWGYGHAAAISVFNMISGRRQSLKSQKLTKRIGNESVANRLLADATKKPGRAREPCPSKLFQATGLTGCVAPVATQYRD